MVKSEIRIQAQFLRVDDTIVHPPALAGLVTEIEFIEGGSWTEVRFRRAGKGYQQAGTLVPLVVRRDTEVGVG